MNEAKQEGHVYLKQSETIKRVSELLENEEITDKRITDLIGKLNEENKLKVQEKNVYLPFMFHAEKELANWKSSQ